MKRFACHYAIIRFLPYPETQEFANVGIVLACPESGYFGFKLEKRRHGRITDFFTEIHPGEILREEYLAPLEMTPHALAIELRVPAPRINDIVRERRAVTPDTALRLARYFGTTAQFWLNLQSSFDLKNAETELGKRINQEVRPLQKAA